MPGECSSSMDGLLFPALFYEIWNEFKNSGDKYRGKRLDLKKFRFAPRCIRRPGSGRAIKAAQK